MTPTIPSKGTIVVLHQLHPPPSNLVSPPIFDFQHEHIFILNRILFAQALTSTPHLFAGGFSRMVYEHLSRCFIPKDPSLGFSKLFQVVVVVICGDIFKSMALMLGVNKLLAMAKGHWWFLSYCYRQGVSSTYYPFHYHTASRAIPRAPIPPSVWSIDPYRL